MNSYLNAFRTLLLAAACLLAVRTSMAAEPQKPGLEEKAFQIALGEWAYEGEGPDTPFYPAGKFKGKETLKMVLNGFFLQAHWKDQGDTGVTTEGIVMFHYDRVGKTYRDHSYESDGSSQTGTTTISKDGTTWVTTSQRHDAKGTPYHIRHTNVYSTDGKSRKATAEYSADGKSWKPLYHLTGKKTQ
jgi:hypothetical protein